jgi:hypothetical protein
LDADAGDHAHELLERPIPHEQVDGVVELAVEDFLVVIREQSPRLLVRPRPLEPFTDSPVAGPRPALAEMPSDVAVRRVDGGSH